MPSKLFVGIGNVLRRDDGVGVRAAERMARLALPPDVEVLDAGTAGAELASQLEDRRLVVVVDGIEADAEPGQIFRMTPEQLQPFLRSSVSLHDLHFLDALEETRLFGTTPEQVVVLAVQVSDCQTGMGLSAPVASAVEEVLRLAIDQLGLPPDLLETEVATTSEWDGSPENSRPPERSLPWN